MNVDVTALDSTTNPCTGPVSSTATAVFNRLRLCPTRGDAHNRAAIQASSRQVHRRGLEQDVLLRLALLVELRHTAQLALGPDAPGQHFAVSRQCHAMAGTSSDGHHLSGSSELLVFRGGGSPKMQPLTQNAGLLAVHGCG